MTETEARAKLIEWLKQHNCYAVDWQGHAGRYFIVIKISDENFELTNDVYGAIYESYYDLVHETDVEVLRFTQRDYNNVTWNETLEQVLELSNGKEI